MHLVIPPLPRGLARLLPTGGRGRWIAVIAVLGAAAMPARTDAQFTRQIILVPSFQGKDRKLADRVGDAARNRIGRGYKRNDVQVLSERSVSDVLERSSLEATTTDTFHIRTLARHMRADEIVWGTVERVSGRIRAWGRLTLTRDARLMQPLPLVEGTNVDAVGAQFAANVQAVRRQLVPHRLCENALREGRVELSVNEGKKGVAAAPEGVIMRSCLVSALIASGADGREVLPEALRILQLSPESYYGLDAAARAYDAIGDKEKAAEMWVRLAASDTSDLPLTRRVVEALLRGGNATHAKPLITNLVKIQPDNFELLRLQWQVLVTVRAWDDAVVVGERLAHEDTVSREDSTFVLRLATAHRAKGDTVKAVAVAAGGVSRFPKDARLYLMYSDLLQADSRIAIERGLLRFPQVAELHLLRAQELRRLGKNAEAVAPFQRAMELDSTMSQGYLALAQTQVELGMLDSAYFTTRRALVAGEEKATIAGFALARGNAIFRAANGTKQRGDYQLALQFLALADSLQSTPQSQFLLGAAALSISQSAATDAPTTKECGLSRLANDMLPLAREKITAGARVSVDAARQYLAYLDQLEPVVAQQVATLCSST